MIPSQDLEIDQRPTNLSLKDLKEATDLHILGTHKGHFILRDSKLSGLRCIRTSNLPRILQYVQMKQMSEVYLTLTDSYELLRNPLLEDIFVQEVSVPDKCLPRNIDEALSPLFVTEWGPAVDREVKGFLQNQCFESVTPPEHVHLLPGIWVFSRKRDGTPKARFCVGGHRQIVGQEYFPFKNYCAVLSSRDNRILLALAASENYTVYQTDVVQAFLHGKLEDANVYIKPPARYPCPEGNVLKLQRAVYGLHQAPIKFKQELIEWFKKIGRAHV